MDARNNKNNLIENLTIGNYVFTRAFNAPQEVIFKAWVNQDKVSEWWGPDGFTNPVCKLYARPGGKIYIDMQGPDGTIYPMTGEYKEVLSPTGLVFVSAALNKEGKPLFEVLNTTTFFEENGKTTQTLSTHVLNKTTDAEQYIQVVEMGWTQSLLRLEKFITEKYLS